MIYKTTKLLINHQIDFRIIIHPAKIADAISRKRWGPAVSYIKLMKRLKSGDILLLDGGTGTELERRGVPMDPGAWCGGAALYNADILEKIHLDYIKSGADIITTNTYSTSRLMLALSGYENSFLEINKKTIEAAHQARSASARNNILIAGSLSHRGALSKGTAAPAVAESRAISQIEDSLTELALILREEGCDFILLEMMYDPDLMKAAFSAAGKSGLPIWAGFSARQSKNGEVWSFLPNMDIPIANLFEILREFNVDSAGLMHTQSNAINQALKVLKATFSGSLFVYPDSGYFKSPNWQFKDIISTEALQGFATEWIATGAQVIGGCCGLTPKHIESLANLKTPA